MKHFVVVLVLLAAFPIGCWSEMLEDAAATNPVQKVIELLTNLQGQVIMEGEAQQKTYNEFVDYCQVTAMEKKLEIKKNNGAANSLSASIEQAQALITENTMKVQELSGSIATDEADLKAATLLRSHERAEFEELDKQLTDTIDTLARARSVLEKELEKHAGSSFLQKPTRVLSNFVDTLGEVVAAATLISEQDRAKLTAFIQTADAADDGDEKNDAQAGTGAPAGATNEDSSSGILETLESMQEKAEETQAEERKKEMNTKHNFDLLKVSLTDQTKLESWDLEDKKKQLAALNEDKAGAEGHLETVKKDIAAGMKYMEDLQHDCMTRASEFQSSVKERAEELNALATAKKTVQQMTQGATSQVYDFLQVSSNTQVQLGGATLMVVSSGLTALKGLKRLATDVNSSALSQLVSRLGSAIRYAAHNQGGSGADPFAKVKGLIEAMIARLQKENSEEATKKEFCDREMSATKTQTEYKQRQLQDVSTKLEQAQAQVGKLKMDISALSKELSGLKGSQREMDSIRRDEKSEFEKAEDEMKAGLDAVQSALKILRDYYSKGSGEDESLLQTDVEDSMRNFQSDSQLSNGAGTSIIGLLEVVESDFSKALAESRAAEAASQDEYEKMTQENEVTRASKEKELELKGQEVTSLEKTSAELDDDKSGYQMEMDALDEYYVKLKPQCATQPDNYEERKQRRDKEMAGLKEAQAILASQSDSEASA